MSALCNYNKLWRILHHKKPSDETDWDRRAASFHRAVSKADDTDEVVLGLDLRPADTVLDMGAGTGRFAVPMAKIAAHVTAVEPSAGMSAFLERGMQEAGCTNYTVLRKRWEDVEIGRDIQVHDVVFASNSVGFLDLKTGLSKLNDAAKRAVHIIWFAGPERHPMGPELEKRLFSEGKRKFSPDYLFIVNVLHEMGIYANVRIDPAGSDHIYEDLEEAVVWWQERHDISEDRIPALRQYLQETLVQTADGNLSMKRQGKRAWIWWEKAI